MSIRTQRGPKSWSGSGSVRLLAAMVSLLLPAGLTTPAHGVVVVQDGKKIVGHLHSLSDAYVVLDEVLPDGTLRRKSIRRSPEVLVINSVKPELLEALREDNPRAYRDYADDLKVKLEDPDCRVTALRLYLIAAHLDPEKHGPGCLTSMATLARSQEEQRRYRAMAYLLDPKHDPALLRNESIRKTAIAVSEEDRTNLRDGLRAFWSGRKSDAVGYASRPEFRAALARVSKELTIEEFEAGLKRRGSWLPPSTLRKVLQLEQSLSPARELVSSASPPKKETGSWAMLDWKKPAPSTAKLSLETVSQFDPRKTRFRNGEWVEPRE